MKLLNNGGFWTPSGIGINKRNFEGDMVGMGEIWAGETKGNFKGHIKGKMALKKR